MSKLNKQSLSHILRIFFFYFQSDGIDLDKNHSDVDNLSNCDINRKLGSSANEYDTCTTTTISSPEPEEYTYEGAIEGYKSRIISQTNSNIVKTVVNNNFKEKSPDKINGDLNKIRTTVSNKIGEKVSSFQNDRANDAKNNNQRKDLPKVDIHKRREQFERENSQESQANKPKKPEIANKKSIKERLSCLEKFTEEIHIQKSTNDLNKFPTEVKPLKERLSSLEKSKSGSTETEKVKRLSNGDLSNTKSLRERLTSLKTQSFEEEIKLPKTGVKEVSMSLKQRLSSLDAARHKEIPKISVEEEIAKCEKNDSKLSESKENDGSLKTSLSGIESQMQNFCRSLDSLDINGQTSPSSFERVQSFEDFDCTELQNNTISSDIETEDSGIHTARDSAPADDIADLTQVASPIGEPMVEISEYESCNEDGVTSIEPTRTRESVEIVLEPTPNVQDIIIEEVEEHDIKTENTDSDSNYLQAVSQPEELTVTEDITEIQMDKEDEDTLKSFDNQDSSVSLNEPISTASEGDTVVFEGKMTIHVNLNEICNNINAGAGNTSNSINIDSTNVSTNSKSMPMVTVSNITTTTNISPKNSIKTLKTSGENHTSLTNKLADGTSTVNSSLTGPVVENRHLLNHVPSSSIHVTNKLVVNQDTNLSTEIAANKVNPPVSSSQDTNPFWQNRIRHRVEPNRRKTILFINNKPKTVVNPNSSAKDLD